MGVTRRRTGAVLALAGAALLAFAYARPLTVFETWAALRLRLAGVRSGHVQAGPHRLHYLEAGSAARRSCWSTVWPATRRRTGAG